MVPELDQWGVVIGSLNLFISLPVISLTDKQTPAEAGGAPLLVAATADGMMSEMRSEVNAHLT